MNAVLSWPVGRPKAFLLVAAAVGLDDGERDHDGMKRYRIDVDYGLARDRGRDAPALRKSAFAAARAKDLHYGRSGQS